MAKEAQTLVSRVNGDSQKPGWDINTSQDLSHDLHTTIKTRLFYSQAVWVRALDFVRWIKESMILRAEELGIFSP